MPTLTFALFSSFRTVCDVMGVPLPDDTVPFEGVSLKPVPRP